MELTVLGASGSYGAPESGCCCSGYLVRTASTRIWLDSGNGTFAMLQSHVKVEDLQAVVLTHYHPDHCVDLYGLYVKMRYGLGRSGLPALAPEGLKERMSALVDDWGNTFDWRVVADGERVTVGDLSLHFSRTDHPPPTLAVEIAAGGKRLVYTSDTGPGWSVSVFDPGADLVLSEASYLHANRLSTVHLSALQAGEAARLAGARSLMITHLWPTVDPAAAVEEAARAFGGSVLHAVPNLVTWI
jgi:ribonuclease BN (tRNA processing enzyme)